MGAGRAQSSWPPIAPPLKRPEDKLQIDLDAFTPRCRSWRLCSVRILGNSETPLTAVANDWPQSLGRIGLA